jgi:hypothetical protein
MLYIQISRWRAKTWSKSLEPKHGPRRQQATDHSQDQDKHTRNQRLGQKPWERVLDRCVLAEYDRCNPRSKAIIATTIITRRIVIPEIGIVCLRAIIGEYRLEFARSTIPASFRARLSAPKQSIAESGEGEKLGRLWQTDAWRILSFR